MFRTSTIDTLTGLFGLHEGMRTAARLIAAADEVILDIPDETVEYVATTLGKPLRVEGHTPTNRAGTVQDLRTSSRR